MARLPVPGSDDGTWGDLLNTFLEVSLDNDHVDEGQRGKLRPSAVDEAGAVMNTDSSTASIQFVVDEDDMVSDSDTKVPTQQSVKAYIDANVSGAANDADVVHKTGNETIAGEKTFTSSVFVDQAGDGKATLAAGPGIGGLVGTYADGAQDLDKPSAALAATAGLMFGSGAAAPDTIIGRAGPGDITVNTAKISSLADPTADQDAATKKYVDITSSVSTASPDIATGLSYKSGKLQKWLESIDSGGAHSNPIDVVAIGDSFANFGVLSRSHWPWHVESHLNYMVGHAQPGAGWTNGSYFEGDGTVDTTSTTAGYGKRLTVGQKCTETLPASTQSDGISFVYRTSPGAGSIIIRDGVGGTVLTTLNTNGVAGVNIWESGELTPAASRVIEVEASGGTIIFDGMYVHSGNRTNGIRMWNAGRSGATPQHYIDNPSMGLDLIEYLHNRGTLKLVLIELGTNSIINSSQLIQDVQSRTDATIVWWIPHYTTYFSYAERDELVNVCESNGIHYIDGTVNMPDSLLTYTSGDNLHPTGEGAHEIAASIAEGLSGNPLNWSRRWLKHWLPTRYLQLSGGTISGALNTDTINVQNGSISLGGFGDNGYQTFKDAGAQPSILISGPLLNNAISSTLSGGGAGLLFGPGVAANVFDVGLNRTGANVLSVSNGNGNIVFTKTLNNQTGTSYTLALTDRGKIVTTSNAGANTLNVPQNSAAAFAIGTQIDIINLGAGTTTVQAGTGATLVGSGTMAQNVKKTVTKISTNGWHIA